MAKFPPCPAEIKPVAHLLKLAEEHDGRNEVVTYWARMAGCLLALTLVPKQQSPETKELLRQLLDWLEQMKKTHADNEGITNEAVAQALIEEYALKVFASANEQDRAAIFNKNTVKLFYTAGMVMDVLDQFGTIPEDLRGKRKYAKWKAAYIHNCLKAGEQPLPGPPKEFDKPTGVVPSSSVPEEELKTYTKYEPKPDEIAFFAGPSKTTPIDDDEPPAPTIPAFPPDEKPPTYVTPRVPSTPTTTTTPSVPRVQTIPSDGSFTPDTEQIQKAQKFCKFAASALNYEDVKTAMDYIVKAMNTLQTGKEE